MILSSDEILQGPINTRAGSRFEVRFRTRLEGVFYGFRMAYNQRDQSWYLDLQDQTGAVTIQGLRMTTGVDLLRPVSGTRPPGQLFVADTSGAGADPSRDSWLKDHRLVYRTAANVIAATGTEGEVF